MATATRPARTPKTTAATYTVRIKIKRYQPEGPAKPNWQEFAVAVEGTDRLLDALQKIKWEQDGTLTFRRSCAHGVCGSDAMRINGRNRLACKVLMKDLGTQITVEPMLGFPIIRDLVVDMDPFFHKYEKIKPFLINDEPLPATERLQSAEQRARYDDTTKCILCGACTGSCPSVWANREWVGPASIVNAHRFIFDSRDRGGAQRLEILSDRTGVWRCRTIFNCTEACPRGIHVTDAIEEVKRAIMYGTSDTE
ncbi:MAG TPA: succinate dehydrogenase iron-sulfur subunit [Ktedonobacterales bacterium]|jgi:succinate dehydrogenase / fumarate reductase iron-sulfur subunit|nr:succinate dehydrogenase iron-sulfur subunit [Ktedonobacterales bacterium]